MSLSEKLVQLGLTHNQAAVYAALIDLGQTKAAAIIKKTQLHRNIVYEALEALENRRLIFKTSKGGVAFFQLSDAATLVSDAEAKLATAESVAQEVNALRQRSQHEVKMYEGFNGLKQHREKVIDDLKHSGEEFWVIASSKTNDEMFDGYFHPQDIELEKLGIPLRILFPVQRGKYIDQMNVLKNTQAKILPQTFKEPTMVDIWNDNVAFMTQEEEPFIVSIQSQELANSFKEYFHSLWNQDVRTVTGLKNVQEHFYRKMEEMAPGEEYMVLGANYGDEESTRVMKPWFITYHRKRVKRGIRAKLLTLSHSVALVVNEIREAGDGDGELSEIRMLPQEMTALMQINVYPDSVAMYYWNLGDAAVVVEVQRKDMRDSMANYFEALWDKAEHVQ